LLQKFLKGFLIGREGIKDKREGKGVKKQGFLWRMM
jgi:hypothetical protein